MHKLPLASALRGSHSGVNTYWISLLISAISSV